MLCCRIFRTRVRPVILEVSGPMPFAQGVQLQLGDLMPTPDQAPAYRADGHACVSPQIQYPGVSRSIRSDVDNLLRLVNTFNLLPEGLYVREAAEVRHSSRPHHERIACALCFPRYSNIHQPSATGQHFESALKGLAKLAWRPTERALLGAAAACHCGWPSP